MGMTPEEAIKIAIHCLGVQTEQEVCEECSVYLEGGIACREVARFAVSALEEVQQYREIGTVEECREAAEKQRPKKPKEILRHRGGFEMHHCPNCDTHYQTDNRYTIKDNYCPVCRKLLDSAFRKYCGNCGQAIDENLEGMEDERD